MSKITTYRPIHILNDPNAEQWVSQAFKFECVDKLPIEVPEFESTYILTCWNSNIYITINPDYTFKIVETIGEEISLDSGYILIRPSY